MNLTIKLTALGIAALVNPANVGTNALQIANIKLGSANYDPTGNENDLQAPIKTLATFGGDVVADNTIHITLRDDSSDTYTLGEIGLYSGGGVLMGIISTNGQTITQKGANDVLLISADLTFTGSDVSNITFGETSFIYQLATPQKEGIVKAAELPILIAGESDEAIALTPAQLKAVIEYHAESWLLEKEFNLVQEKNSSNYYSYKPTENTFDFANAERYKICIVSSGNDQFEIGETVNQLDFDLLDGTGADIFRTIETTVTTLSNPQINLPFNNESPLEPIKNYQQSNMALTAIDSSIVGCTDLNIEIVLSKKSDGRILIEATTEFYKPLLGFFKFESYAYQTSETPLANDVKRFEFTPHILEASNTAPLNFKIYKEK